ncbi:MAG: amino acid adenylation domain-containing protein [Gemmatirosa sp.]|nr:amino acid adenylation domain-containing protein [Gemmatirosa sp.]
MSEWAGKGMDLNDADLGLLDQLLGEEGVEGGREEHGIRPRPAGARVPLSFSQELLWLLDQASPGLTAYNVSTARRLVGALDVQALERALTAVAARHEVLRTRFGVVDGEPSQIVDAPGAVPFNVVDLTALPADEREAEMSRVLRARARTPFDMAKEHLFRATLVKLAETDHALLVETHHAVCDGWSLGVIMREVAAFYRAERTGGEPGLTALAIQFGDYAAWQRDALQGERLERLLAFWRGQLGDATEPLALPTDYPAPATPTYAGARLTEPMTPELLAQVKALGREHDATLYMTLLAAYATVLHRYTGRRDVLIGSGIAGRTERETESMVGYFNNTLVQRADFTGDPTFAELLGRVRDSALGAYDHQEVPLEKLILELRSGQARVADEPLFQAVFTMQDTIGSTLDIEGLEVRPFGVELGATKFDITLLPSERVTDRGDDLLLSVRYRSDLFAPTTMQRFLGHLRQVLETAVANPDVRISAIPLFSADEREALADANATYVNEGAPATVAQLFEAQAARVPQRVAVLAATPGKTAALTYAELNARANQLAHRLRALGIGASVPVGLVLDRSADALVGLLGILKAGGCYVPASPELPAARIKQQLAEAGAKAIVTLGEHAEKGPAGVAVVALDRDAAALGALPTENPAPVATPNDLAYVLYTSGSTGTPKGVAVTHANVVHYTRAVSRVLGDVPAGQTGDGLAALDGLQFGIVSTLGADLGNTSLYPALLAGATLHVLAKEVGTDPTRFVEYVSGHQLDVLKLTPNHLRALLGGRTGADLASVLPRKWLVTGGEALAIDFARTLSTAGACRVLNHYGPTETTVGVLTYEVTAESLAAAERGGAQTVPIGRPLANTRAYVVDKNDQPVPSTVPGELCIGGAGVTNGYLNRPELTAERFTTLQGDRVYRTGDRVRRLADGAIEFLGRVDDQVKVRGYRVELGEIEHALRAHPGVGDGAVVLRPDAQGEPQLVAYAVAKAAGYAVSHGDRATPKRVKEWLGAQLPEYMVPNAVVLLDALPLNANGKLDRNALPDPDATTEKDEEIAYAAPRTTIEHELVAIWEGLFPARRIGIRDDFFQLGGHSLLAIRLLGKIKTVRGQRLPMATLFENSTIEKLAVVIGNAVHAEAEPPFVVLNPSGTKTTVAFVHGDARGAGWYTRRIAKSVKDHKLVVLPTIRPEPGAPTTIEEMAAKHLASLKEAQPTGPYVIGGYCAGGLVALEMAQRLRAAGDEVKLLVLVASPATNSAFRNLRPMLAMLDRVTAPEQRLDKRAHVLRRARYYRMRWWEEKRKPFGERARWAGRVAGRMLGGLVPGGKPAASGAAPRPNAVGQGGKAPTAIDQEYAALMQGGPAAGPGRDVLAHQSRAAVAYVHDHYDGPVAIVAVCEEVGRPLADPTRGWGRVARGDVQVREIATTHVGIVTRHLEELATTVGELVGRVG